MAGRTDYACGVLAAGLFAGVAGAVVVVALHQVEHLVYDYSAGTLLSGVTGSGPVRRMLGPTVGGVIAGAAWWLLRRRAEVSSVSSSLAGGRRIATMPTTLDALIQVLLVGSGASLGREGAPRAMAAAWTDALLARWAPSAAERRVLVGCAAGAGLGAVYGVPLGGAMFSCGVLLGEWRMRTVGTALVTSALAVAVAAPVTHFEHPVAWPGGGPTSAAFVPLVLAAAPVAVVVGLAFGRLTAAARPAPAPGTGWLPVTVGLAGLATGVASVWLPEIPGNGRSILTFSVGGGLSVGVAMVLLVLKPLLVAGFLRAGAVGGLITPALATGAVAGTLLAATLSTVSADPVQSAAVSLTCAAGVLAVTQRAPAFGALFVWELARPPVWLLAAFAVTAFGAHALRRYWDRRRARRVTDAG